jgi:hypothetical protein
VLAACCRGPIPAHRAALDYCDGVIRRGDDPEIIVFPVEWRIGTRPTTPSCSGSGPCTRTRPGRRASAPARSSSDWPESSTGSTHLTLDCVRTAAGARRQSHRGAGRRAGVITAAGVSAGIDMGAHPRVPPVRGRRRAGHPARHRVRPAATVRLGRSEQGVTRDPRARRETDGCHHSGLTRRLLELPVSDRRGKGVRCRGGRRGTLDALVRCDRS